MDCDNTRGWLLYLFNCPARNLNTVLQSWDAHSVYVSNTEIVVMGIQIPKKGNQAQD